MDRNEKLLKKLNVLTETELMTLGIKAPFSYGDFGFIDTDDEVRLKQFSKLIKTGKYAPVSWCCEGDTDYFTEGWAYVNRFCYALRRVYKTKAEVKSK